MDASQPQSATLSPQDPIPVNRLIPQDPIPCRIVMPAEVAFNIDLVQKMVISIAERVGCQRCFSGVNCTFQLERDFIVDPGGLVHGAHELFGRG